MFLEKMKVLMKKYFFDHKVSTPKVRTKIHIFS